MKVIFLDVDGVLNSAQWDAKCSITGSDLAMFDPAAAIRIVAVCKETDAGIVLSSTWRFFPDFVDKLKKAGLPIIGKTPRGEAFGTRADEIRAALGALYQQYGPFPFAIVDDEPDAFFGFDPEVCIHTDSRVGLTAADCAKIVGLFT